MSTIKDQLGQLLKSILEDLGVTDVTPEVEVPENPENGDYTTNVAMRLAKTLERSPMEIALQVKEAISPQLSAIRHKKQDHNILHNNQKRSWSKSYIEILQAIERVEVVPPGFINIFLIEASLVSHIDEVLKLRETYGTREKSSVISLPTGTAGHQSSDKSEDRKLKTDSSNQVMVEFAHPNTHKAFHIGHLRNIITGESMVRLLESQGYQVIRANYQGDVGMHIAKALYALLHISSYKKKVVNQPGGNLVGNRPQPEKVSPFQAKARVEFLGKAYAAGAKVFEEDVKAKEEIADLNALIYATAQRYSRERGIDPGTTDYLALVKPEHTGLLGEIYDLWKETRQWSLDYFETIYRRLGSTFDRYYFESECLSGVDRAKDAVKRGVLKESEGAIIFDGKPYGMDTRVFVNSLGLPTYEAKELALSAMEFTEFGALDRLIHVVGPEQASFFRVTFKVEELLGIQKNQQHHLIYGWVRLKAGKMSSRSGNVVLGEWLLDSAKKEINTILEKSGSKYPKAQHEEIAEKAAVAAVKYAFLKVSTLSEIAFDLKESVSFEGDSGPYLLYTYARAKSVLRKAVTLGSGLKKPQGQTPLNPEERAVARLILYFPDVVANAAATYAPNTLATYLFKLAQAFNLFYAKHPILAQGSPRKASGQAEPSVQSLLRLSLTSAVAQVLKNGLALLGIEVLERM